MPSRHPPFDNDEELPEVRNESQNSVNRGGHSRDPNYLFRRAIAVGAVVAVIATGAIVAGRLIGGDESSTSSGGVPNDWNRVVLVNERTGQLLVNDADGETKLRISTDARLPTDIGVVDTMLMLSTPDQVAIVDLSDESVELLNLETNADGVTMPSGSALTLIAADTSGQRAVIGHGPTQEQLDTDFFAPVTGARYDFGLTRSDPSGRHLLVTDSGNFQSVLFSFDRDEPSFFPGLALAVNEELVVTAQNVGNDATVSVFDHAGEQISSGRTPSVRAAMIAGNQVVLVTVDGEVLSLSAGSGNVSSGDQLEIGTVQVGHVATSGDRLIVVGSAGTAIISTNGNILGEFEGAALHDTGLDKLAPRRSRCLVLSRSSAREILLVDMEDGSTVAEAPVSGTAFASADGCTAAATTADGFEMITADGNTANEVEGDIAALSPDGAAVVAEDSGRLDLIQTSTGSASADPATAVDMGRSGQLLSFAQL